MVPLVQSASQVIGRLQELHLGVILVSTTYFPGVTPLPLHLYEDN